MFWPSFNGALAHGSQQHRVVINTVLSLCGSCVTTFYMSALFRKHHEFNMIDIQNATLAGGVAVGACSDLVIQPWGAITTGCVAGTVSSLGFMFLQPYLLKKIGLHDTCGIHNLHGMPGIIGGIGGVISSAKANAIEYGTSIGIVFPRRAPSNQTLALELGVIAGEDRSASSQGAWQLAALATSVGIGLGGGIIVGTLLKMPIFQQPNNYFQDNLWWETPDDYSNFEAPAPSKDEEDPTEEKKRRRDEIELTSEPNNHHLSKRQDKENLVN